MEKEERRRKVQWQIMRLDPRADNWEKQGPKDLQL